MSNRSWARWWRGRWKVNCTFCHKAKRMHTYKWGQRRPRWKASKGSKAKNQAHVVGGGEETKRIIEAHDASPIGRAWNAWQCLWWCAMPCYKNNNPHIEQVTLRWAPLWPVRDQLCNEHEKTTSGWKEGGGPKAEGKKWGKKTLTLTLEGDKTHYTKEKHKKDVRGNGRHP
jgi:hypothetical protein